MSTVMIWQTSSTSSADTEKLGELLGKQLNGGEVIELLSDLGGGKTTFVRGLARGAGSDDRVASPTFTLSRIYKAKNFEIQHFDFYRLSQPGILEEQLTEALTSQALVIVEWAEIVKDVLPNDRLSIEFEPMPSSPDERRITVRYPEKYRRVVSALESAWQEVRP